MAISEDKIVSSSTCSTRTIPPKGVTLNGVRVFFEVEEDSSRHYVRLAYAVGAEKPVVAGTLALHPFIAAWLLSRLEQSGAEVDVERQKADNNFKVDEMDEVK